MFDPFQAIRREHILRALQEVDRTGVPPGRVSRRYLLVHDGKTYPPKYVLSLAHGFAVGRPLPPESFSGGAQTNSFLAGLGFEIRGGGQSAKPRRRLLRRHSESCPECKARVTEILVGLYGAVKVQASTGLPARPTALADRPGGDALGRIYAALADHRGHRDFIRVEKLPPVDYLIAATRCVVEFDERQHFTPLREIALAHYHDRSLYGFDVDRWRRLCTEIAASDSDPPHRDEQRAWYDALRDHLPLLEAGFAPGVRIRADDFEWCHLSADRPDDRALVRDWAGLPVEFDLQSIGGEEPEPFWGRLIIEGPWYGGVVQARRLLAAIADEWPRGRRAKVLVAPGGFLSFRWPGRLGPKDVGDPFTPRPGSLDRLFEEADHAVRGLLDFGLRETLCGTADYLSIGVDSLKSAVSISTERITELHAELVYLVDLRTGDVQRTGKSYPTAGQAPGLVRNTDLASHFVKIDDRPALLLGCHDLNIFHPRARRNAGEHRRRIMDGMDELLARFRPQIAVHHPHTADSPGTWRQGFGGLRRRAPFLARYAGAGRFAGAGGPPRAPLAAVLDSTRRGASFDVVAQIRPAGRDQGRDR